MSNPVVLITGGLTGIGRAAAVAFAKKDAKVVVAGRRDDAGKALVEELRSLGAEAEFINADVRNEDEVRAMVDETVARLGLTEELADAIVFIGSDQASYITGHVLNVDGGHSAN
jgi:NAD(P)-dependent dehydrogenase (short-subunit alcohol dehydrogenase family)